VIQVTRAKLAAGAVGTREYAQFLAEHTGLAAERGLGRLWELRVSLRTCGGAERGDKQSGLLDRGGWPRERTGGFAGTALSASKPGYRGSVWPYMSMISPPTHSGRITHGPEGVDIRFNTYGVGV